MHMFPCSVFCCCLPECTVKPKEAVKKVIKGKSRKFSLRYIASKKLDNNDWLLPDWTIVQFLVLSQGSKEARHYKEPKEMIVVGAKTRHVSEEAGREDFHRSRAGMLQDQRSEIRRKPGT